MNLYELKESYLNVQDAIENGLDLDEVLQTLDDEIETKADNYAKIIQNMTADVEAIKNEEKRLKEKRQACEKGIKRLKENLQNAMIETGKRKFKTDLFSFSIAKNGGALPVIVDVDVSELPDDLVIITEKPDTKAITKYINDTGDLSYAHFGERGESLRIK